MSFQLLRKYLKKTTGKSRCICGIMPYQRNSNVLLKNTEKRLKLHPLINILISWPSPIIMKVDISNRRLLQHVKAYGIVLTMKLKVLKNCILSKKWINEVKSIAKWSVQY